MNFTSPPGSGHVFPKGKSKRDKRGKKGKHKVYVIDFDASSLGNT